MEFTGAALLIGVAVTMVVVYLVVGLVHQVLPGLLGATSGLLAAILLHGDGGPRPAPSLGLFAMFGYALLIVGVVLSLHVLIPIFQRE